MILRHERNGGAALLSLPRDLWVPIAGTDESAKINTAYNDGPERLAATITEALGIPIHHYVEVDFHGFKDLVDGIGGVEVCTFETPPRTPTPGCASSPGCQTLNGAGARLRPQPLLRGVERRRLADGRDADLGRIERQQLFIREAVNGCCTTSRPSPFSSATLQSPPTSVRSIATVDPSRRSTLARPPQATAAARRTVGDAAGGLATTPTLLAGRAAPTHRATTDGARGRRFRPATAQPILDYFRGRAEPPETTDRRPARPTPIGCGGHEGADPRRRRRNPAAADHPHQRQAAGARRQQADPVLRDRGDGRRRDHRDRRDRRRHRAEVMEALGDGSRFGATITYIPQDAPLGLAHCVLIARDFLGDDDFVMYLGDNLLEQDLAAFVAAFEAARRGDEPPAAQILLKQVPDPHRFGIATLDVDGHVVALVEKPADPPSDLALVGVYLFDRTIHDAVAAIEPSARGELEITDAIQWLIDQGHRVRTELLTGWWIDTGKLTPLLEANRLLLEQIEPAIDGKVDESSSIDGRSSSRRGRGGQLDHPRAGGDRRRHADRRQLHRSVQAIGAGCESSTAEIEHSVVMDGSRSSTSPASRTA